MSANRSVWDDSEKALLKQIRSGMRKAKLSQVSQAFNKRNHQYRTTHAIKAKLKEFGLNGKRGHGGGTRSDSFEERPSTPSPPFLEMRYAWSMPELGIFIPLHPLIAEARRHASRALTSGHAGSVSETPKWPSVLGGADISWVRCEEEDRVALRNYLDYLKR